MVSNTTVMVIDENLIVELERRGIVTPTFRKLAPAKKAVLYDAVMGEVAQSVFDRAALDNIAAAAEVSKGSLIQYFRNKNNMFFFTGEIFAGEYRQFLNDFHTREHAVRTGDRISNYFVGNLEYWERSRVQFRFYMKLFFENNASLTKSVCLLIRNLRMQSLKAIVSRGIETGQIRRDIDIDPMAVILHSMLCELERMAAETQVLTRNKPNIEAIAEKMVSAVLDGFKA